MAFRAIAHPSSGNIQGSNSLDQPAVLSSPASLPTDSSCLARYDLDSRRYLPGLPAFVKHSSCLLTNLVLSIRCLVDVLTTPLTSSCTRVHTSHVALTVICSFRCSFVSVSRCLRSKASHCAAWALERRRRPLSSLRPDQANCHGSQVEVHEARCLY